MGNKNLNMKQTLYTVCLLNYMKNKPSIQSSMLMRMKQVLQASLVVHIELRVPDV